MLGSFPLLWAPTVSALGRKPEPPVLAVLPRTSGARFPWSPEVAFRCQPRKTAGLRPEADFQWLFTCFVYGPEQVNVGLFPTMPCSLFTGCDLLIWEMNVYAHLLLYQNFQSICFKYLHFYIVILKNKTFIRSKNVDSHYLFKDNDEAGKPISCVFIWNVHLWHRWEAHRFHTRFLSLGKKNVPVVTSILNSRSQMKPTFANSGYWFIGLL